MTCIRSAGLGLLSSLLLAIGVTPAYGTMTVYDFHFQTQGGQPVPTGSFGYDPSTGAFTNFFVVYQQVTYDFTPAANFMNLHRMPFELGFLGPNLVDGQGPLGPGLSHWYAGANGFEGFEWRTPAQDFLSFSFTADLMTRTDRYRQLYGLAGVYPGTWTTTVQSPTAVPEPATWSLVALAALAGARAAFRKGLPASAAHDPRTEV